MKRLTLIGSAVLLAGGWQLAQAQPPGGGGGPGGGRGRGPGMTFEAIDANKDGHLDKKEVEDYFNNLFAQFAARGGGPGGGGGGGGRAGGGGGPDIDAIFSSWDTQPEGKPDGMITKEEFDARPQGRRGGGGPGGGGRGGPGGPPPQ